MEPVATTGEMRAADAAAISGGTPGVELMDRAAMACAAVTLDRARATSAGQVTVVCGPGNNGGDGIACARHLRTAGVSATVLLLADPKGDAAHHLRLARRAGVRCVPWPGEGLEGVVVDAVLGTGSAGEPRGIVRDAVVAMNESAQIVSVDIPSGVSGDDGSVSGPAVRASVTVAIQALKPGHVTGPGSFMCGRIDVAEIGIPVPAVGLSVPEAADVAGTFRPLEPETHKYRTGAVTIVAGSPGMTGAAVLSASAAARMGAGLVFLCVPAAVLARVEDAVTEAVKVGLPHDPDGRVTSKAFDDLAPRLDKSRAVACGPGLGRTEETAGLVRRLLDCELPLVCDADAIWALGMILDDEPDLLRRRLAPCVVTPHSGELEFIGGHAGTDHVAAARETAARTGAVVHLKGRRAVTARPDGPAWVNPTGTPALATAGTGDVLTGMTASLISQGADAVDATWAAAFVHGRAADVAVARLGDRAIAASDVARSIPDAVRSIRLHRPPRGPVRTVLR